MSSMDSAQELPSRPIRLYLHGQLQQIHDLPPDLSLLQYLRRHADSCGSKEGCAEGDCGACTVLVTRFAQGELKTASVNACMQYLGALDGCAVWTVEDLAQGGQLHPAQQAILDCHGSQCGFCTPGFAVSLADLQLRCAKPQRAQVVEALSGNLCRCTGYKPLIEAGLKMQDYTPQTIFDPATLTPQLAALHDAQGASHSHPRCTLFAPRSVEQALRLRAAHPDACVLAGGTDVGIWLNKQLRQLPQLLYLGKIDALQEIHSTEHELHIGAMCDLNRFWLSMRQHWPQLEEYHQRFASHPVRNAGSIGGNLANGSPIGDAMPLLIALGARIELGRLQDGRIALRQLALEDFYLGYQRKDLGADELLLRILLPLPDGQARALFVWKIAKRFDQDISSVAAAIHLHFAPEADGQRRIHSARIAFGGMAATPKRARATEQALQGRWWDEAALAQAQAALTQDFQPLDDLRASAAHRMRCARNLLHKAYLQSGAGLPAAACELSAASAEAV
ncbi:xanthine dehydrogenase small subunit [Massilia sp. W12]|uniref:xanthine dehydrogenase small subunit n=1 Tax=Massilia sp. W12 TaxID=3126507 RepID=UPI0030CE8B9B